MSREQHQDIRIGTLAGMDIGLNYRKQCRGGACIPNPK
jgi:hypothetical protein